MAFEENANIKVISQIVAVEHHLQMSRVEHDRIILKIEGYKGSYIGD